MKDGNRCCSEMVHPGDWSWGGGVKEEKDEGEEVKEVQEERQGEEEEEVEGEEEEEVEKEKEQGRSRR